MKGKKDSHWIFLSLYYPEQAWPFLLQKAVIPFLQQHAHAFCNYILHFGKDRGDHIGLSFEVFPDRYKQFVEQADLYFRGFMQQFPASHIGHEDAVHETKFVDFPPNTVCHSLHHFLPIIQGDNGQYTNLWRSSSDCLLKIYGEAPFDKEDFFTAMLYLNLMLMLSFGKNSGAYLEILSAERDTDPVDEAYTAQFSAQQTLFMEIRQDCLNIVHGIIAEELEPIATWFGVFSDYLQTFKGSAKAQSQLLKETIIWLRAQLNMISDGGSFIDFCIHWLLHADLVDTADIHPPVLPK
jgi:hypothetical protein